MSAPPIAHAGHWIVNLLYLVPLLIVIGMLAITSVRDRRAEAAEGAGAPVPDPPAPDESAAP
jgi:ABC-type multidrug transport system permease subunit